MPAPNMQTESKLAGSRTIAALVVQKLNLAEGSDALLENLTVRVPTESEIIELEYSHSDPAEAQRRAQAFAETYLEYRRDQALTDLRASAQEAQERLDRLNERTERLQRQLARATNPADQAAVQSNIDALGGEISLLQQRVADLSTRGNIRIGAVAEPASIPTSPASPNHLLNAALGGLAGLVLGVGVAFLREYLDDHIRGRSDVELYSGAPVLAMVPRVSSWQKSKEPLLVALKEPDSPAAEAYRQLRTNVLFAASQRGTKTVLVTSCQAEEGKTSTTANLGVTLAGAGKRTILVSADLRKPRLHRFFGVQNGKGLTNVLLADSRPVEALQQVGVDGLRVLSSGPVPGNPGELLGSGGLRKVLAELQQAADLVLIDAAPILPVADASALIPIVDAVILVVDASRVTRSDLAQARQQLERVNAHLLGAVLNNVEGSRMQSYASYSAERDLYQESTRGTA